MGPSRESKETPDILSATDSEEPLALLICGPQWKSSLNSSVGLLWGLLPSPTQN